MANAHDVAFWWQDLPLKIPAGACILILPGLNPPTVRTFGEIEYWFATIKIGAILALIVTGLQIAVFALLGIELVGPTGAETKDTGKNLPRAVTSIPLRVLLFSVGSLIIFRSLRPWTGYTADGPPFVGMFAPAVLIGATGVVNFVVPSSATSSANSVIYSTSRMICA